jgi:ATP-binding cassette subfamily A (ABC1) protein 3
VFADLAYALPREHTALFAKIFTVLQEQSVDLGVVSFGIAGASIEDVFLKVGEGGADDEDGVGISGSLTRGGDDQSLLDLSPSPDNGRSSPLLEPMDAGPVTGVSVLQLHLRAMFMKRYLHLKRNTVAIVPQLLVPSAFVLFALIIAKTYPGLQALPARNLNAMSENYGDNTVVLSNTTLAGSLDLTGGQSVVGLGSTAPNMSWALLQYACASTRTDGMESCAAPNIAHFNRRNMVALDTPGSGNWTAWFNGQAYHTSAEVYAMATNAVLNSHSQGPTNGKITTINHPLPRTAAEELEQQTNSGLGFSVALMVIFGMSFLVAYFIIFPVTERASKAKRMQLLSGVNLGVFWGTSFLFDFANYLVPAMINVVLFAAFAVPSFSGPQLQYVVLIFLMFGLAAVPIMYAFSFLFGDAATAYSRAVLLNVVTGIGTLLTVFILQATSPDPNLVPNLKDGFLIFPNFCFGQAFVDM